MEWSWTAWLVSIAGVVASGAVAAWEGNWSSRPGLAMGFRQHAGMWGDALLLPVANALVVPFVSAGPWLLPAMVLSALAAVAVHAYWYRGGASPTPLTGAGGSTEHMWPARRLGTWHGDLSWAGWLHVGYVAAELTLLAGFAIHTMPRAVVVTVVLLFTVHVPIGLLQPRWALTGDRTIAGCASVLGASLVALWTVAAAKW